MSSVISTCDLVACTDSTVLILGETGVGKELMARRLHKESLRCKEPFITIDVSTIPETLVESELFGYEKGAFTGADRRKPGRLELAHKGTLFIDEIGEIPLSIQVKLLRVIQEKTFSRIGGARTHFSDFRLVAATNRNLEEEVAAGRFRRDLFYRINIVPLVLPPLRDRKEDIVILAHHFFSRYARKYNRPALSLSPDDEDRLKAYGWPGNIRELKNVMERAALLSSESVMELIIPSTGSGKPGHPFSDRPPLDEVQRRYIDHVLKLTGGRIGGTDGAAAILGLKRTTLYTRMKKLGIPPVKKIRIQKNLNSC